MKMDKKKSFVNYVGTYKGCEHIQNGNKKNGDPYSLFKVMFKHSEDLKYPVKMTLWVPNKHNVDVTKLIAGQLYKVNCMEEPYFNEKQNKDCISRTALNIEPTTDLSLPLGFGESNSVDKQEPIMDGTKMKEFVDGYKVGVPAETQNVYHAYVAFICNLMPEAKTDFENFKKAYNQ